MRKVLLLAALCAVLSITMATAVSAQENGSGCPPGTTAVEGGCQLADGTVQTPEQIFACEGIADQATFEQCAAEQAAAGNPNFADYAPGSGFTPPGPADGVCEGSGEGDPDCAEALLQSLIENNPELVGATCPEGYAAFGDPGTGELACVSPNDPSIAQYFSESGETASSYYTELPDTGGPSLFTAALALVLAAGGAATAFVARTRA